MTNKRTKDSARIQKLKKSVAKARSVRAPENSLGQWIGYFLDRATHVVLEDVMKSSLSKGDASLKLLPNENGPLVTLPDDFGDRKQIDHAIFSGDQPVVIVESKWLKDKRHLNDKGAWIRQLDDIVKENSVKQALLVLGGPWESYRSRMEKRGFGLVIVSVDTVYESLGTHGIAIEIDHARNAFKNPGLILNQLLDVVQEKIDSGDVDPIGTIGMTILNDKSSELRKLVVNALKKN